MNGLSILYVGQLNYGSTCYQRMCTFKRLGHAVDAVNMYNERDFSFIGKAFRKLKIPLDFNGGNKGVLDLIGKKKYDILWIDKGLQILPFTLKRARLLQPGLKIVAYSPDDMLNPSNQSRFYLNGIALYDHHITTKSYNITELKGIGAKSVLYSDKAYDPQTHRVMNLSKQEIEEYGCDVGFIGHFEGERFRSILYLTDNGIKVTVRGPGWSRLVNKHSNLTIIPRFFMGDEYVKVINATKINLCFLRKENRDLQTARSIEIPACGGFMLAERTTEHSRLFNEGKEAVFFSDDAELLKQVKFYLDHEYLRRQIAEAGKVRCDKDGYSTDERLSALIQAVYEFQTNDSETILSPRKVCFNQSGTVKGV